VGGLDLYVLQLIVGPAAAEVSIAVAADNNVEYRVVSGIL